MKVYVMTDMECVAGVVTLPEYCLPGPVNKYGRAEGGRYYEHARDLATMEVNAAVEGLLEGGATEVLVRDGHGHVGLNPSLIHEKARILTGKGQVPPCGLDGSFDAAIMLGQHAKANTDGGHLCHSYSFFRNETILNGVHHAEIAFFMNMCSYFDVPVIMICGDVAACEEARELVPSIETVAVIEGQKRGSARGMTVQQALDFNVAAIHVPPVRARRMIKDGARRCLRKIATVERFKIDPPYEYARINRPDGNGQVLQAVNRSDDFVELLAQPAHFEPVAQLNKKGDPK